MVTHPDLQVITGCIASLKKGGGPVPPSLREVQRLAKDPLCFWARADLRELLLPLLDAVRPDASSGQALDKRHELEALAPFPVTAYMTAGHQAYQGACSMNIESLEALAKVFAQEPASPEEQDAPRSSEP